MKPLSREWIDKAEGDYKVVEDEWQTQDPVYDAVCFHAQQCVEKYLKAWLTEKDVTFVRTHDLTVLSKLAAPFLSELAKMSKDLIFLTSSAVEVRYPGTLTDDKDAAKCRQIMLDTRTLLRNTLGF